MDPVLAGSLAYALGIRTGLEHFLPVQVWIGALGLGAILTFAAWKKEWSRDFYMGLFLVCIFCAGTSRGTVEKQQPNGWRSSWAGPDGLPAGWFLAQYGRAGMGTVPFYWKNKRAVFVFSFRKADDSGQELVLSK